MSSLCWGFVWLVYTLIRYGDEKRVSGTGGKRDAALDVAFLYHVVFTVFRGIERRKSYILDKDPVSIALPLNV